MKHITLENGEVTSILTGSKTRITVLDTDLCVGDVVYAREQYWAYCTCTKDGFKYGKRRYQLVPELGYKPIFIQPGNPSDRSSGMPGWYRRQARCLEPDDARLVFRVKQIRKMHLHDITMSDIKAEGHANLYVFQSFWRAKYGVKSWPSNPMICVIEFDKL